MPFTKESAKMYGKMGGKPKGTKTKSRLQADKALEYIRQKVTENLEDIINTLIVSSVQGDSKASKELLDRAYGKPVESVEIKGEMILKIDG